MSWSLLKRAWEVRGLSAAQKVVLARLADRVNNEDRTGITFPSQASLAEDTGLSERSVRTALRELARLGHIEVRQSARRSAAGFACHEYVVHPLTPATASGVRPEGASSTPEAASAVTPETPSSTPAKYVSDTGKIRQRRRKQFPPNPNRTLIEPKGTPKAGAHFTRTLS